MDETPTDKILKIHYPNVDKPLLRWLNDWIGRVKCIRGNADAFFKWRKGSLVDSRWEILDRPGDIQENSPVL